MQRLQRLVRRPRVLCCTGALDEPGSGVMSRHAKPQFKAHSGIGGHGPERPNMQAFPRAGPRASGLQQATAAAIASPSGGTGSSRAGSARGRLRS